MTRAHLASRRRATLLRLELLEDRRLLSVTAWSSHGRDAQHTAQSTVAGQPLEKIRWQTSVDTDPQYAPNGSLLVHYGTPLSTVANTIIVPELNRAAGGFDIKAFDGATGAPRWVQTEAEEYVAPSHNWIPSYTPALAPLAGGPRLYFPGAGGTAFYRDSPDAAGAVTPGRIAFYGTASYLANPAAYGDVRISSPLTPDSQGNLFFTYRASGTNPLGLTGGIARISAAGVASYAEIGTPALNSAPALSLDESTLYIVATTTGGPPQPPTLRRYNSTTLAFINQVTPSGSVLGDGTSSPTIGPDGHVYFGTWSNSNNYRGFLQHYSPDLTTTYPPGSFGWDITPSIVPASMVTSYSGTSSYLLMTKYNDYAGAGGTGINEIAIIDPNATEIDPISGLTVMDTVISIAGPTPDEEFPDYPGAVREWCINTTAVDPATNSIFANNEDGWLYRWDTTTNTFSERIQLTDGIGEAYTPTMIGADGTVYAINNATLFAVGRAASIVERQLLYDGSKYDGNAPGISPSDDDAIAPDKSAYLPGSGTSTFDNVSSYTRGINGLMIDLSGPHGAITANDFVFKIGNNNSPSTWATAPAPTAVTVRTGAGAGDSDRIELVWAPGAIRNTWLEVVVRGDDALGGSNTNTGLLASDVFFFGSAPADSGAGNASGYLVNVTDETSARNDPHGVTNPATITNVNDFDRNGLVNSSDQVGTRIYATSVTTQLKFLAIGAGGPFAPSAEKGDGALFEPADAASLSANAVAIALAVAGVSSSAPPPRLSDAPPGRAGAGTLHVASVVACFEREAPAESMSEAALDASSGEPLEDRDPLAVFGGFRHWQSRRAVRG